MQPVLVYEAPGARLQTVRERAERRGTPVAIYTMEMFSTGKDEDNRAAVKAVPTGKLDLVGLALRAPHGTRTRSCAGSRGASLTGIGTCITFPRWNDQRPSHR